MRNTLDHIMLGPVQLSPHLRLRGLIGSTAVVNQITRPAEGDGVNIMQWRTGSQTRQPGRKLTLDGSGWHFDIGQLKSIESMQSIGQPVLLEHHVWSGLVLITAITNNGLAIDYADYDDTDWIDAQIDLIEV